jgi:hypothetical protein
MNSMNPTRLSTGALLVGAILLVTGCEHSSKSITVIDESPRYTTRDADLIATNYNAVDFLLRGRHADIANKRILVATVVDLDDVCDTSTFGRLTGELLASRLVHHGYAVVHMTVRRDKVVINDEGEFLLSRDMRNLARDFNASAVLVSTYTPTMDRVYLSVKLANAVDGALLAAIDYAIPNGRRTRGLLNYRKSRTTVASW